MRQQDRYNRQTILPEIGREGQQALSEASVLCVGAGGLGSPALLYMAAAGIGHIGIVDFDNVEISNLHRQILFKESDVGLNKAKAAQKHLQALNAHTQIKVHPERLDKSNIESLIQDYNLIVDASDNFDTKFLINDAALKYKKPWVYASILGFEGQLAVFNDSPTAPCYRCLFPEKPTGHIQSCADAGVIGALAGILGAAQGLEAIKTIVRNPTLTPLSGKLWTINGKDMSVKTLTLSKDSHCTTCSCEPNQIKLQKEENLVSLSRINTITPEEAKSLTDAIWLDVREQAEWDTGHIEGALHAPLSEMVEGNFPLLPDNKNIIIYCRSGQRSQTAIQILSTKGYKKMFNLNGGILAMS